MASLIDRIQSAVLGSVGPERVREVLTELAIPAGGSGEDALRRARIGFLRPISDEAILRDALGDLGLTGGGGGGDQALWDVRNALLHNLHDSEATLRDGLNGLLEPGDLGEGGGGAPAWVPEGAVIHIDLVRAFNDQDAAWVSGTGVVAVDTLLGNDPNVDFAWANSEYDPENLSADGYLGNTNPVVAMIGAARTLMTAGATARMQFKQIGAGAEPSDIMFMSADGTEMLQIEFSGGDTNIVGSSASGPVDLVQGSMNFSDGAVNAVAFTIVDPRFEMTANGAEAESGTTNSEDRPPASPLVSWVLSCPGQAIQSITIYAALPDTTGLSELSEV